MSWFNYYGLIFMVIIMIPNIVYAVKNKDGSKNAYKNRTAEIFEQIGRYACFVFMVFHIPYACIGFYFSCAELVYLIGNGLLVASYCLIWLTMWKRLGIARAVLLSVLPSLVFLFSGIMLVNIPLMVFAVIFAVTHVLISVKNAVAADASSDEHNKP